MTAPSIVQVVKFRTGSGTSGTVTSFATWSATNAVYVGVDNFGSGVSSMAISDSVNGAYTLIDRFNQVNAAVGMFNHDNVAASIVNLTWATNGNGITLYAHELTSVPTSSTLLSSARAAGSATTSLDTGSATNTGQADAMYLGLISIDASANPTTININATGTTGTWNEFSTNARETNGASFMVGSMVNLAVTSVAARNHVWNGWSSTSVSGFIVIVKGVTSTTQTVTPLGIASSDTTGDPALGLNLTAVGLESPEVHGPVALAWGLSPLGIASLDAPGDISLLENVSLLGIPSPADVGSVGASTNVVLLGVPSSEALGDVQVALFAGQLLSLIGIPSGEALGAVALGPLLIGPLGVPSSDTVGGAVASLSVVLGGIPSVGENGPVGVGLTIAPLGVPSPSAMGGVSSGLVLGLLGIPSSDAEGNVVVSVAGTGLTLTLKGIPSLDRLGNVVVIVVSLENFLECEADWNLAGTVVWPPGQVRDADAASDPVILRGCVVPVIAVKPWEI